MKNLERWMERYRLELRRAMAEHPEKYTWHPSQFPIVVQRMEDAFKRGSYNKDSTAIRRTCKHFAIPHTLKGINCFLRGTA